MTLEASFIIPNCDGCWSVSDVTQMKIIQKFRESRATFRRWNAAADEDQGNIFTEVTEPRRYLFGQCCRVVAPGIPKHDGITRLVILSPLLSRCLVWA